MALIKIYELIVINTHKVVAPSQHDSKLLAERLNHNDWEEMLFESYNK